ncbi:hypothetical protein Cadr_000010602 [Camelus dromedarius]|uniref:Uncharacterized protein n=1 Tax=Camelus dromedarius TaxID=9838 RepID=A0A5N4DWJ3_CAMDR|nr:hypothetical protein Cadr_000010602 [Camelus dromedarius]
MKDLLRVKIQEEGQETRTHAGTLASVRTTAQPGQRGTSQRRPLAEQARGAAPLPAFSRAGPVRWRRGGGTAIRTAQCLRAPPWPGQGVGWVSVSPGSLPGLVSSLGASVTRQSDMNQKVTRDREKSNTLDTDLHPLSRVGVQAGDTAPLPDLFLTSWANFGSSQPSLASETQGAPGHSACVVAGVSVCRRDSWKGQVCTRCEAMDANPPWALTWEPQNNSETGTQSQGSPESSGVALLSAPLGGKARGFTSHLQRCGDPGLPEQPGRHARLPWALGLQTPRQQERPPIMWETQAELCATSLRGRPAWKARGKGHSAEAAALIVPSATGDWEEPPGSGHGGPRGGDLMRGGGTAVFSWPAGGRLVSRQVGSGATTHRHLRQEELEAVGHHFDGFIYISQGVPQARLAQCVTSGGVISAPEQWAELSPAPAVPAGWVHGHDHKANGLGEDSGVQGDGEAVPGEKGRCSRMILQTAPCPSRKGLLLGPSGKMTLSSGWAVQCPDVPSTSHSFWCQDTEATSWGRGHSAGCYTDRLAQKQGWRTAGGGRGRLPQPSGDRVLSPGPGGAWPACDGRTCPSPKCPADFPLRKSVVRADGGHSLLVNHAVAVLVNEHSRGSVGSSQLTVDFITGKLHWGPQLRRGPPRGFLLPCPPWEAEPERGRARPAPGPACGPEPGRAWGCVGSSLALTPPLCFPWREEELGWRQESGERTPAVLPLGGEDLSPVTPLIHRGSGGDAPPCSSCVSSTCTCWALSLCRRLAQGLGALQVQEHGDLWVLPPELSDVWGLEAEAGGEKGGSRGLCQRCPRKLSLRRDRSTSRTALMGRAQFPPFNTAPPPRSQPGAGGPEGQGQNGAGGDCGHSGFSSVHPRGPLSLMSLWRPLIAWSFFRWHLGPGGQPSVGLMLSHKPCEQAVPARLAKCDAPVRADASHRAHILLKAGSLGSDSWHQVLEVSVLCLLTPWLSSRDLGPHKPCSHPNSCPKTGGGPASTSSLRTVGTTCTSSERLRLWGFRNRWDVTQTAWDQAPHTRPRYGQVGFPEALSAARRWPSSSVSSRESGANSEGKQRCHVREALGPRGSLGEAYASTGLRGHFPTAWRKQTIPHTYRGSQPCSPSVGAEPLCPVLLPPPTVSRSPSPLSSQHLALPARGQASAGAGCQGWGTTSSQSGLQGTSQDDPRVTARPALAEARYQRPLLGGSGLLTSRKTRDMMQRLRLGSRPCHPVELLKGPLGASATSLALRGPAQELVMAESCPGAGCGSSEIPCTLGTDKADSETSSHSEISPGKMLSGAGPGVAGHPWDQTMSGWMLFDMKPPHALDVAPVRERGGGRVGEGAAASQPHEQKLSAHCPPTAPEWRAIHGTIPRDLSAMWVLEANALNRREASFQVAPGLCGVPAGLAVCARPRPGQQLSHEREAAPLVQTRAPSNRKQRGTFSKLLRGTGGPGAKGGGCRRERGGWRCFVAWQSLFKNLVWGGGGGLAVSGAALQQDNRNPDACCLSWSSLQTPLEGGSTGAAQPNVWKSSSPGRRGAPWGRLPLRGERRRPGLHLLRTEALFPEFG